MREAEDHFRCFGEADHRLPEPAEQLLYRLLPDLMGCDDAFPLPGRRMAQPLLQDLFFRRPGASRYQHFCIAGKSFEQWPTLGFFCQRKHPVDPGLLGNNGGFNPLLFKQ